MNLFSHLTLELLGYLTNIVETETIRRIVEARTFLQVSLLTSVNPSGVLNSPSVIPVQHFLVVGGLGSIKSHYIFVSVLFYY